MIHCKCFKIKCTPLGRKSYFTSVCVCVCVRARRGWRGWVGGWQGGRRRNMHRKSCLHIWVKQPCKVWVTRKQPDWKLWHKGTNSGFKTCGGFKSASRARPRWAELTVVITKVTFSALSNRGNEGSGEGKLEKTTGNMMDAFWGRFLFSFLFFFFT